MGKISKLFTGYFGGGTVIRMPKHTTKINHSHDSLGRPTETNGYSFKYLRLWFGKKEANEIVANANKNHEYPAAIIAHACNNKVNDLPSYMNPNYRRPYSVPKRIR